MYGTVEGNDEPQWYMVDLDYSHGHLTGPYEIVEIIEICTKFLKEYTPSPIFRPVAEQMLSFVRGPELLGTAPGDRPDTEYVEELELDLLDYLDTLDHL